MLAQPGRRFYGIRGDHAAACTIQRHVRGHQSRQRHGTITGHARAVVPIQRAWRTFVLRREFLQRMDDMQHDVRLSSLAP